MKIECSNVGSRSGWNGWILDLVIEWKVEMRRDWRVLNNFEVFVCMGWEVIYKDMDFSMWIIMKEDIL